MDWTFRWVALLLAGMPGVSLAMPVSYYIYSNGEYESFAERGHDFDSFHDYGSGLSYVRGEQVRFGSDPYRSLAAVHAGTPSYTALDIADVLWSGSSTMEVRFAGDNEVYHIYSDGRYESSTQRGVAWDAFYDYGSGLAYTQGEQVRFGSDAPRTLAAAHAGTPSYTAEDIVDVLWSGSSAMEVRFAGDDEVYHIYSNGQYESSTQRGVAWDAFYVYASSSTAQTSGDQFRFDNGPYRTITPRYPGGEVFSVSDISNVLWVGNEAMVVNFVPEPSSLALLLVGAAATLRRRSGQA